MSQIDEMIDEFKKDIQEESEKHCPKNSRGESLYTVLYDIFDAIAKEIQDEHRNRQAN